MDKDDKNDKMLRNTVKLDDVNQKSTFFTKKNVIIIGTVSIILLVVIIIIILSSVNDDNGDVLDGLLMVY